LIAGDAAPPVRGDAGSWFRPKQRFPAELLWAGIDPKPTVITCLPYDCFGCVFGPTHSAFFGAN
jgi:hypothetical protein